jgi:hypothetical protein
MSITISVGILPLSFVSLYFTLLSTFSNSIKILCVKLYYLIFLHFSVSLHVASRCVDYIINVYDNAPFLNKLTLLID